MSIDAGRGFVSRWALATTTAFLIASLLQFLVRQSPAYSWVVVVISAAILGVCQWLVLRDVPAAGHWFWGTALGACLGPVVQILILRNHASIGGPGPLGSLPVFLLLAGTQWLALRAWVTAAAWWIPCTVGAGLVGAVLSRAIVQIAFPWFRTELGSSIVMALVSGLVLGVITGLVMAALWRQPGHPSGRQLLPLPSWAA